MIRLMWWAYDRVACVFLDQMDRLGTDIPTAIALATEATS